MEEKMKFPLSVSKAAYQGKCENWGKVQYQKMELDLDSLENLVRAGYCFTHTFKGCDSKIFSQKEKTIANFESTNLVFIDVDESPITAPEFIQTVTHTQPSLLYTTPSNIDGENNRYRLVYQFEEPIKTNDLYKEAVQQISQKIQEEVPYFKLDKSCQNCSQQMGGNGNEHVYISKTYKIYSFSDFNIDYENDFCIPEEYIKKEEKKSIPTGTAKTIENTDPEFLADFWKVTTAEEYWRVFHEYSCKYPIYEETPVDKEIPFIELNKNHIQIRRRYYKARNDREGWVPYPVKVKKGDRHRTLFNNARLRLKMLPEMTFEHLLFCLLHERFTWISNGDGAITNQELYKIAKNAYLKKEEIDFPINKSFAKYKTGYKVNPRYCEEQGVSAREMTNYLRGYASQKRLEEHYDFTKSVKENAILLKEKGIEPNSERRLYDFLKEKGVNSKDWKKLAAENDVK